MDTIEHFPIFTRRSVPHARVEATPGFGNIAAQNRPPSRLTAAPQRYRHLGTRATWPGSTVCLVDEHDDGIADSGFGTVKVRWTSAWMPGSARIVGAGLRHHGPRAPGPPRADPRLLRRPREKERHRPGT